MEAKNEFDKNLFKLMINSVFGKTMENLRKHRDIKLVTTDEKRSKLISEPNYHSTKRFSENLLAIEMKKKKTKVKMNKLVYLGMSILDISKTLMYKFWNDQIKPKYEDRGKGMNKKVHGFFKDKLGGKIMKEFVALRAKTYAYLIDDDGEVKKSKGTKKCVIKCDQIFKSYHHKVQIEEVNKITLKSDDDKRLQTFDRVTTYSCGTNTFKVCKSETMVLRDFVC